MYTQQLDPSPYIYASYLIGALLLIGYFFFLKQQYRKLSRLDALIDEESQS